MRTYLWIFFFCLHFKDESLTDGIFLFRAATVSGRAAGPDGDVPLFHHFAAEVSSPVPSGIHSHRGPEAGHDPPTQTVLHLCGSQAAQEPQLCGHSFQQVGSKALKASSTVWDRLFFLHIHPLTQRVAAFQILINGYGAPQVGKLAFYKWTNCRLFGYCDIAHCTCTLG